MLYNLLFMGVSMLIPIATVIAYRQGIKDGRAVSSDKPLPPIISPPKPKPKPKLSAEDKRLGIVLDNINNYDGTAIGQREVRY